MNKSKSYTIPDPKAKILKLEDIDLSLTYSYSNYLTWLFDDRVELVKGKVYKMSGPARRDQEASIYIAAMLFNFLLGKPCKVYSAPFDVRFYKGIKADQDIYTILQPDICVICDLEKLDNKGCNGSPNLIIEIVSEQSTANSNRDVIDKYEMYAINGVAEYWLVRPIEKTIQKNLLNFATNKYEVEGFYGMNHVISSSTLPNFEVAVNYLLK